MLLHHCCPVVGLIVPCANVHPVTLRSARDKLLERRNRLIEDVIKHDPDYKPPADYKPRKFVSKVYMSSLAIISSVSVCLGREWMGCGSGDVLLSHIASTKLL